MAADTTPKGPDQSAVQRTIIALRRQAIQADAHAKTGPIARFEHRQARAISEKLEPSSIRLSQDAGSTVTRTIRAWLDLLKRATNIVREETNPHCVPPSPFPQI